MDDGTNYRSRNKLLKKCAKSACYFQKISNFAENMPRQGQEEMFVKLNQCNRMG